MSYNMRELELEEAAAEAVVELEAEEVASAAPPAAAAAPPPPAAAAAAAADDDDVVAPRALLLNMNQELATFIYAALLCRMASANLRKNVELEIQKNQSRSDCISGRCCEEKK